MATHWTRSITRAESQSAPPEPQQEESYYQEGDPNLDNLSDYLADKTRGSIHKSEINAAMHKEQQEDPEASTSRKTYTQKTLDEWRDPNLSSLGITVQQQTNNQEQRALQ